MKGAVEAVDRLFSNLGTILRFIAPGFAALFVAAAVVPNERPFLSSGSPAVVVLGMLLGPTIYGLHTGPLLRLVWLPIILLPRNKTWKLTQKTISNLDEQRWLRRASEKREVLSIQRKMDKWGAMLNFLYCLSYMTILIPTGAKWICNYYVSSNWRIVLISGVVVLVGALRSEYHIIEKETHLTQKYPNGQKTETVDPPDPDSAAVRLSR